MQERNSEMKMTWAVVVILGAHLLGVDVGQLVAMVSEVEQQAKSGVAGSVLQGDLSLPAVVAAYIWSRTKVKMSREVNSAA